MSTVAPELFERAAELLEDKGWTRGKYCEGGRHCALGALAVVIASDLGVEPFKRMAGEGLVLNRTVAGHVADAGDHLGRTLSMGGNWDIPDWNDDPKRKRAQVLAGLRKTAERLRASD